MKEYVNRTYEVNGIEFNDYYEALDAENNYNNILNSDETLKIALNINDLLIDIYNINSILERSNDINCKYTVRFYIEDDIFLDDFFDNKPFNKVLKSLFDFLSLNYNSYHGGSQKSPEFYVYPGNFDINTISLDFLTKHIAKETFI